MGAVSPLPSCSFDRSCESCGERGLSLCGNPCVHCGKRPSERHIDDMCEAAPVVVVRSLVGGDVEWSRRFDARRDAELWLAANGHDTPAIERWRFVGSGVYVCDLPAPDEADPF